MFSLSPAAVIAVLNAAPPEAIWVLLLVVCFATILVMLRLFGEAGLYVYVAVAILGANLQILKQVLFPQMAEWATHLHLQVFADPVALGTILFSSTYLCTDILTEHFGRAAARRAVLLGFASFLFWTVLAVLTLGFAPLTPDQAGDGLSWALGMHDAIATLFTPVPAFFVAGMTAYLLSQFHDIWLFRLIGRLTGGRYLWLRNNVSTMLSALIDNTVFSVLAWVVFAPEPLGWRPLIFTFILGTYVLRMVVAALDTPFLYLARLAIRPGTATPEAYA